jgi:hypothetical protein
MASTDKIELVDMEQLARWVAEAEDHDYRMWQGEVLRYNVHLCVARITPRDRREYESEAKRAVKSAYKFWKNIPFELRERVCVDAGLPMTAIPEDLRSETEKVS